MSICSTCTHGFRYTTVSSLSVPVFFALPVECLPIPIESERTTAAGRANFEERTGPIPAFVLIVSHRLQLAIIIIMHILNSERYIAE